MLSRSRRHLQWATCLCFLLLLASVAAQEPQPIPGRPWTAIIPDPDTYDWSSNNRPGYRFRGMEPIQRRFYDHIKRRRAEGAELSWAERLTIRQLIAVRRWPEGPRPNEYWAAYMRYLRSLPSDDLNAAQTIMLTELTRFGFVALDRDPTPAVTRIREYLGTGPFEARNWFERTFGRAEDWMGPWLDYQLASHGHPLAAPGGTTQFPAMELGEYRLEYTISGGAVTRVNPEDTREPRYSCAFTPGTTARISGRARVGSSGAAIRVFATAHADQPDESKTDKQEFQVEGYDAATGEPSWHAFEASVGVPESGHVSLEIRVSWRSLYASPRLKVVASAPMDGSAITASSADAAWAQYVNETLAKLGYSDTPLGLELKRLRDALAGSDADWKRYVDEEQRRLGYDSSPEAVAYRELNDAAQAGGEQWAAYVEKQTGQPLVVADGEEAPPTQPGAIGVGTGLAEGELTGVADTFDKPLQVTTKCKFRDLPDNTAVTVVWYRDGVEAIRGQRQTGGNGFVTFAIGAGGQPLPAGRYRVEISALGKTLGQSEFTITDGATGEPEPDAQVGEFHLTDSDSSFAWTGGYPAAGGTLALSYRYREPGTIIDTVGVGRADVGDFALTQSGDGSLCWQIFDPGVRSAHGDAYGWHRLVAAGPIEPMGWHKVEVSWGPGGMRLVVDGEEAASDPAALSLSAGPVFIGDFPDDGQAAHQSMVGKIRNIEFAE